MSGLQARWAAFLERDQMGVVRATASCRTSSPAVLAVGGPPGALLCVAPERGRGRGVVGGRARQGEQQTQEMSGSANMPSVIDLNEPSPPTDPHDFLL